MLYQLLRATSSVALRWYYADIVVQGAERIPARGPLIVVSNHPNALVDALVVGTTVRRRLHLTAKATLFEHPLLAPLLRATGVVPLRRARDERTAMHEGGRVAVLRNADAFRFVTEALRRERAVLVFPEGVSHDEPALAPLRTGAARMALAAGDAEVRGVQVLPLGLVFEQKERPRSRVLARVGEPIDVDAWRARTGSDDAARLTADIDAALRRVTLNFGSESRARRALALARTLAALAEVPLALGQPRALATEADIAHRIEIATDAIADASPATVRLADELIARVEALEARLATRHVALEEIRISPQLRHGAGFVAREAFVAAFAYPVALVGRATHWLPLRAARALALTPLPGDRSRDQPAMRTIVFGFVLLLVWYVALGVLLARRLGGLAAVLSLLAIFLAARVDSVLHGRLRRAWARARTYLALRADPALREEALEETEIVLAEAVALERALVSAPAASPR